MDSYKDFEEIRNKINEALRPLARIVLTNYGPGAAPKYEDIKGIIIDTITKTTEIERTILEMEKEQLLELNKEEDYIRKLNNQRELERMTKAEQDLQDKKTEFIMK